MCGAPRGLAGVDSSHHAIEGSSEFHPAHFLRRKMKDQQPTLGTLQKSRRANHEQTKERTLNMKLRMRQ